jgi:hypothetical protein
MGNMIEALANGGGAVASVVSKLKELEAEKVKLSAELEAKGQADNVLRLHPKTAERYARAVEKLGDTLRDASTEEREVIRSLVASVTVFNDADDGSVAVDISGRIRHLCVGSIGGSGGPSCASTPGKAVRFEISQIAA